MRFVPRIPRHLLGGLVVVFMIVAACGDDDTDDGSAPDDGADQAAGDAADTSLGGVTITVYSGRGEDLIGPVFDLFEERTGANVEVRYGDSADMALLIDTEGDQSPADVFISQSPGAVGFLDSEGRLVPLPEATLERVPPELSGADGTWVGITGRVRVLVYNTDVVGESELPASVLDLVDPRYEGMVAVAPANGSFQDFVTAMRAELGDSATSQWLQGMAANNSPNYPKNSAIVDAVTRGEVPMGLVNHYYLVEALDEDPGLPGENLYFADGDLGSLLIVTGAGIVDSTDQYDAGVALIDFLLSDEAQELSASGEKEYPLVPGVPAPEGLLPLDEAAAVTVDLQVLAEGLAGTQRLIAESGIQQ